MQVLIPIAFFSNFLVLILFIGAFLVLDWRKGKVAGTSRLIPT